MSEHQSWEMAWHALTATCWNRKEGGFIVTYHYCIPGKFWAWKW